MITSFDYLPVLVAVFWKSGGALGAALCVNRLLRKKSTDVRRLVLSTVLGAMFVAAAALPRWILVTPLWSQAQRPAAQAMTMEPAAPPTVDDATDLTAADTRPAQVQAQSPFRGIDLRAWLIPPIWFAGAAMLLTRFAIARHSSPDRTGGWS